MAGPRAGETKEHWTLTPVEIPPIVGKRIFFPPGHVAICLDDGHRRAYLRLYGLSWPLPGVPELKDRDFDGRTIKLTRSQLAALNLAFLSPRDHARTGRRSAFEAQEQFLTKHFKEMQFS